MIRRFLLGLVVLAGAVSTKAQDAPALVEYYGDGVHAYFSGRVFDAHRLLSQAINGGIQDPRAYYFRAMTLLRMGRDYEAEADMQAGAYLEARSPSGAYAVDRSIQRIQGRNRLKLERIRRSVRFDVEQERRTEVARRFEETRRREAEVLRPQTREGFDEAVRPAGGVDSPPTTPPAGGPAGPPTPPAPPPADALPQSPGDAEEAFDDPFAGPGTRGAADAAGVADTIEVGQKVKGSELVDILSGIVGSVVEGALPRPSISFDMPPVGLGGPPMGVEGGPFDAGDFPADDEFGPFGEDDPFDGAFPGGDDPFGADDDPFGGPVPTEPAEDDPFGGMDATDGGEDPFRDNPFGEDGGFGDDDADPFGAADDEADGDLPDPFGGLGDDPFN